MVITILAILLALAMSLGGALPNVANGLIHQRLDEALNHPQKLVVEVHPNAPSYTLLGADMAFADIYAEKFVIQDFPVESLAVHVADLSVDAKEKSTQLRKPAQAVLKLKVTEQGLNQFLQSETFQKLWEKAKSSGRIPIDADLTNLSLDLKKDRVLISGKAETLGGFFTVPFKVGGTLRLMTERQLFIFDPEAETLNRPISKDILETILKQLNPLLDMTKWSDKDQQLYFRELHVKDGMLELVGELTLNQLK